MLAKALSNFIHKNHQNQVVIPPRWKGDFNMGQLAGAIAAHRAMKPSGGVMSSEAFELHYCCSGTRFDKQAQAEWAGKLRPEKDFEKDRKISRREFAVLIDTYLRHSIYPSTWKEIC